MSLKPVRIAVAALAALMATPLVAHAQIYSWRDAAGNLVLSDRPKEGGERTFAVGTTGAIRTTRAAKRNTTYDPIIAEHSSFHGVLLFGVVLLRTPTTSAAF